MGKLSLGELDSIINRKREEQAEVPEAAAPYIADIDAAADRYGVPREYARRLVQTESNFNPNAVSPAGAQGLMQIVPKWHPNVDPFNPKEAIDYGIRYLRENADRFGKDGQPDWRAGAAAYNAGPGTVERRGMDNLPAETRAYVPKVIGEGQPSQPASPQRKTRLSFNDIDSIINPQEPDGYLKTAAKGLVRGAESVVEGAGSMLEWGGEVAGSETVADIGRNARKYWQDAQQNGWAAPDEAVFGGGDFLDNPSLKRAVGLIAQAVPWLGASLLTGGGAAAALTKAGVSAARAAMLGGAVGGAALGTAEGAGDYIGAREAGKSIGEASKVGALSSIGTAVLEAIPTARFLRGLKGGIGTRFLKGAATEGITEGAQTGWQNLVAKIGYEPTRQLAEGLVDSIVGGAGVGGVAGTVFKHDAEADDTIKKANEKINQARAAGATEEDIAQARDAIAKDIEGVAKDIAPEEIEKEIEKPVEATMKDWEDSTRQTGLGDDDVAKEIISKVAYGPIEEKPTEAKRVGDLKSILEGGVERGKRELKIPGPLKKGDIPGTEVDIGAQAREIARRKNAEAVRSDIRQAVEGGLEAERGEETGVEDLREAGAQEEVAPEAGPLRYDPSVNQHNGEKLTRGDVLTDDEGNRYALDRDSGFMLTLTEIDEGGKPKGIKSFSVDPTDTDRFKNLYKAGENIYEPAPPEGTTVPEAGAIPEQPTSGRKPIEAAPQGQPGESAVAPTGDNLSPTAPEAPVDQTGNTEAAPEINADEVIRGLEAKGFYGTIDRLNRGAISLEDAADELAGGKPKNIPTPEAVTPADFAAELKGAGVDRKESWSRWVQKTSLKPGMDAKDWYKIYNSVTPSQRPPQAAPVASQEPTVGEPQAQAWELSLDSYLEQERKALQEKYPNAKPEMLENTIKGKEQKWHQALADRAKEGRIPDEVLDDYENRFGTQALQRTFRGEAEKGAEGWVPKDVRKQEAPAEKPKDSLDKQRWERTWDEQRKAEFAGVKYKVLPKEYREAKKRHKAEVQQALRENKPVPEAVLKDYPDLQKPATESGEVGAKGKGADVTPTTVRELAGMQEGEASAAVLSSLSKGDSFKVGGKEYTVTSISKTPQKVSYKDKKSGAERSYKKTIYRIKSHDGKTITTNLIVFDNGTSTFLGVDSNHRHEQLSRDIEGDLSVDLINENNPFHEKSDSFKLAQKAVDKYNSEQPTNVPETDFGNKGQGAEKVEEGRKAKSTAKTVKVKNSNLTEFERGLMAGATDFMNGVASFPDNSISAMSITKNVKKFKDGYNLGYSKEYADVLQEVGDSGYHLLAKAVNDGAIDTVDFVVEKDRTGANRYYIEDKPQPAFKRGTETPKFSKTNADAEYLDAVKRGDMETAQRMVDEAAKKAGYGRPAYHGTNAKFTVFDTNEESANREEHAWVADYPEGTVFLSNSPDMARRYGQKVMNLFIPKKVKTFKVKGGVASAMDDEYAYEVFNHSMIEVTDGDASIYATLDPNLIKSADPVTYDDNGKVIPLSQRFDTGKDDIRFNRGTESPGLPKQEVVSITRKVSKNWKGAPDFAIHSTQETFPEPVQAMMGEGDIVKGVLYKGTVHIASANISSEQELIEVIFHEITHYGFNQLGPKGKLLGLQIYGAKKSAIADILEEPGYGFDVSTREGKIQAADEWLAREAQTNPESTWVDRAVRLVKDFIRKLGFDVKLSDAEIRAWLADMRHVVVEGKAQAERWGDARFMVAYHGTPHVWQPEPGFPHGRPRLDKFGTGEGGGAYGWGWYSAEMQDVADGYRSFTTDLLYNGKNIYGIGQPELEALPKITQQAVVRSRDEATIEDFLRSAKNTGNDALYKEATRLVDSGEITLAPTGSLYTLDIPDDVIPKLLDWDAPLSEQSEYVKKALAKSKYPPEWWSSSFPQVKDPTGKWIYERLRTKEGGDKAASEYLASIGIPGNTHGGVSQGATGAKYVIWDQDVLDRIALLERNGEKLDAIREEQEANPDIQFMRGEGETSGYTEGRSQIDKAREALTPIFDKTLYWIVDKNRPISLVQKKLGETREDLDLFLRETQRPKITAAKVKEAWDTRVVPMLEKMAEHKLRIEDLEAYSHALHAPERNKAMREARAKMYLDAVLGSVKAKESKALRDEISELQEKRKEQVKEWIKRGSVDPGYRAGVFPKENLKLLNKAFEEFADNEKVQKLKKEWDSFADRLSGMTNKEAAEILKEYEGNEAIREVHRMLSAINDEKLEILREAGVLPEEEYQAIKAKYEHYVPLHREGFDDSIGGTGRGLLPAGRGIKTAAGSTRNVVNIVANTISNFEAAIDRAEKAESSRVFLNLLQENPRPDILTIEPQKKEPRHDKYGNLRMYPDTFSVGNDEIRIMVDGRQYLIKAHDADAKYMLRTLKAEDAQHGPILNALAKVNRWLARVNTSWSPEFVLSNFVRDIQTAGVNIGDTGVDSKKMFRGALQSIRAIYAVERDKRTGGELEALYDRYKKSGGKIGWSDVHGSVEKLAGKVSRELDLLSGNRPKEKVVRDWLQWVEDANTSVENGIRLHVFKLATEQGVSDRKAAQIASDITVDFTKKGAAGPVINSLYLFANAGIQGSYRIIRAGAKSKKVRKVMGGIVAAGFLSGLMNSMAGDDDDGEDYFNKLDAFILERNAVFMLPGTKGKHVKIPLPWGYNFFWNAGVELSRAFTKEDYSPISSAGRLASVFAGAFNPIASGTLLQTLSPTVADPFVQVAENKNWFGGELMPQQNIFDRTPSPDSQRYWKSAGVGSKWVAETLNSLTGGSSVKPGAIDISPETLDLVVDTVGGSALRVFKDALSIPHKMVAEEETQIHEIPFLRRVAGEQNEWVDSRIYRDNVTSVLMTYEELKAYSGTPYAETLRKKSGNLLRLTTYTKKTESRLRKLRKIRNAAEARGDKQAVNNINDKIKSIQKQFNKVFNART